MLHYISTIPKSWITADSSKYYLTLLFLVLQILNHAEGSVLGFDSEELRVRPYIMPSEAHQTATIIFLNDYDDGIWFCRDNMDKIRQRYMKAICPHAATRPITYHRGHIVPSWFDFKERLYPQRGKNISQLESSNEYLHELIESEIKNGIPPQRIIIAGLAQGGAMAIHAALSFPGKLGALVALQPFQPEQSILSKSFKKINKDIPILQTHITNDKYTENHNAKEINEYLKAYYSKNTHYREYDKQTFIDVRKFCREHVGPLPSDAASLIF